MKTDNYLSLCLDQAAKSALHYRHGYDGGSLKHGRVANGAFDGSAVADLKTKLKKQKKKPKEKQQQQQQQQGQTFVPFEGTGGGHGANTPLSMHSEMMAIHSALAASSTLSCSAMSSKKPCFKLPSGDKRKARLRRETLAAYVNAVCETAQRAGQPQGCNNEVQQQDAAQAPEDEDRDQRRVDEERRVKEKSRAFHAEPSGEKHHQKNQKNRKKKCGKKAGHYEYQYDRHGHQTQLGSQRQPFVSKHQSAKAIQGYDSTSTKSMSNGSEAAPASVQHDKHEKDYKRSGKMRTAHTKEPPQPDPMLLPKGQTASSSRSVTVREKHPRLNGADMYVARLGWCRTPEERIATAPNLPSMPSPIAEEGIEGSRPMYDTLSTSTTCPPSSTTTSTSGSLHDELLNREPSSTLTKCPPPTSETLNISAARASRPCYRCITYMHSVGIKRVFWTNNAGKWEGGKVRDLVDALDNSMENVALGDGLGDVGGPTGNGVFVTKHKVLMLKRMMGRREGG